MQIIHPTLDEIQTTDWDVIVLGAGPAGSLAAQQLAKGGARVLLVEKRLFPRWKVCGACLNGQARAVLEACGLGDLTAREGGVPLDGFRIGLRGRVSAFPLPEGRALSRSRFDQALVEAAVAAGATFICQTSGRVHPSVNDYRRVELEQSHARVDVKASVVVVAAGLGQRALDDESAIKTVIARNAKLGAGCVVSEFPPEYASGTIHMAVGRHGYVGLVRVEDGSLNIAAAFDGRFLKQSGTPARAADLVLNEAGFAPIPALGSASWQGTIPLTRWTTPVAGHRLMLIGDATGYVEPFTGEGMGWGLTSARAVAPLVLRGLSGWNRAIETDWIRMHRQIVGRRQRFCRWLAHTLRHPRMARGVLEVASRVPSVSVQMMKHLNKPPISHLPI